MVKEQKYKGRVKTSKNFDINVRAKLLKPDNLDQKRKKEPPKKLPKYDLFAAPMQLFNWDKAGVLFKSGLEGKKDIEQRKIFNKFLGLGYEIHLFYIVDGMVYIIFELK